MIIPPESAKRFGLDKDRSQVALATILNVGIISVSSEETGHKKPGGTAAAGLARLTTDVSDHADLRTHGPVASGHAIYGLRKAHLEEDQEK